MVSVGESVLYMNKRETGVWQATIANLKNFLLWVWSFLKTLFCHPKPLFKHNTTIIWNLNLFLYPIFIRLGTITCGLRYRCSWLVGSQFHLQQLSASLTLPQLFHCFYDSIFSEDDTSFFNNCRSYKLSSHFKGSLFQLLCYFLLLSICLFMLLCRSFELHICLFMLLCRSIELQ